MVPKKNRLKLRLSDADWEKFGQAQAYSKPEDSWKALEILKKLVVTNPDNGLLRAIVANMHDDLGEVENALEEYSIAIKLAPECEVCSLGYFHILWDQDRTEEALAEIRRFMTISDSQDYREIIKELKELMDKGEDDKK